MRQSLFCIRAPILYHRRSIRLAKKRGLKIAAADAPTERYVPYIGVTIEGDIFILP